MKKLLWISRHSLTSDQLSDLTRICGGAPEVTRYGDTVARVADLAPLLAAADAVAAVLPTIELAELKALLGEKPLYISRSARVPTGEILDGEVQFHFVHAGWYQILRLEADCRKV
ncbi:MAG: hypothetical protein RSC08_00680 [Oscillospiraceae bacterium]